MAPMSVCIIFLSRVLLVLLFLPFSALDKVLNFRQAVGQASQAVSQHWLATAMICAGLCVEVLMSAAILTGWADRLAAAVMSAYCLVTALLWKRFWKAPDFKLAGASRGREVFWDFLKNVAVAGGFLVLACGVNAAGVRSLVAHPWSSSQPYRSE